MPFRETAKKGEKKDDREVVKTWVIKAHAPGKGGQTFRVRGTIRDAREKVQDLHSMGYIGVEIRK